MISLRKLLGARKARRPPDTRYPNWRKSKMKLVILWCQRQRNEGDETRSKHCFSRQVAMYLARELTDNSLPKSERNLVERITPP